MAHEFTRFQNSCAIDFNFLSCPSTTVGKSFSSLYSLISPPTIPSLREYTNDLNFQERKLMNISFVIPEVSLIS